MTKQNHYNHTLQQVTCMGSRYLSKYFTAAYSPSSCKPAPESLWPSLTRRKGVSPTSYRLRASWCNMLPSLGIRFLFMFSTHLTKMPFPSSLSTCHTHCGLHLCSSRCKSKTTTISFSSTISRVED